MFPIGGAALVRLKRLLMPTLNHSVYGRWIGAGLAGVCGAEASVVRGAPGGGVFGSIALPNFH
jgi:hypothetical protein